MSFWDKLKDWFSDVCPVDGEPEMREVTVHKGDYLERIATIALGDPRRAEDIVAANPDRQWDERRTIYPGEKLRLPKAWTVPDHHC